MSLSLQSVRKVSMVKTVMSLVDARMGALVITSRGSVLVLLAGGAGTATGVSTGFILTAECHSDTLRNYNSSTIY